MPASATVRGGRKLRRILSTLSDPRVTNEAMGRAIASVLREYVIPRLKAKMPVRTGRLRDSLRVVQRGRHVRILARFYHRWQRIDDQSIAEFVIDEMDSRKAEVTRRIGAYLRQRLGI